MRPLTTEQKAAFYRPTKDGGSQYNEVPVVKRAKDPEAHEVRRAVEDRLDELAIKALDKYEF